MINKATFAAALIGGAMLAAPASAAPLAASAGAAPLLAQTGQDAVQTVQYRRYGGGRGFYGPRYGGYRGGYYRRGGGRGAAVGAGIAAGAIGALAAGALAAQPRYVDPYYGAPAPVYVDPDADAIAYCSRRFRTYDPATGTYIANGGVVRSCP